ncbi:MAG: response regulator [Chloroflexi bacterium]|nr:response regulator [Chloroflexota bacterium]
MNTWRGWKRCKRSWSSTTIPVCASWCSVAWKTNTPSKSPTKDALAWAPCSSSAPDLVILDLMMPEVDGFAVIDAMQADPNLADVPVILLTATTI